MPRRRRRFSRLGLFYFLLLAGLLWYGSFRLDRHGQPAAATVREKREEITVRDVPQGDWDRWYRIGVEFPTRDGALGQATVTVAQERFDALHPGDRLDIRYLPEFPLLVRSADRSTGGALREAAARLGADPFLVPFLMWLGLGGVALWIASRVATAAVFAVGLAWIGFAIPLMFPARVAPALGPSETTARVEAVSLVTKAPARRSTRRHRSRRIFGDAVRLLAAPYQVVQLRLPMPGRPDSVIAVDAVDSASVPGLAVGAMLAVRYDPRAPRDARLAQGTRTFLARNRYHLLVPVVGIGVICVLGAWGARARRGRRSGPTYPGRVEAAPASIGVGQP